MFEWSRRLYGIWGGFLSLSLWVFCPNVLAHGRLITTDMGSTSLGVAATFAFWLYLQKPSWCRAVAAGVLLGLAELTKFSMLLLYAVWPFLWLCQFILVWPRTEWLARRSAWPVHGAAIVAISFLTIDAGYLFEGVGKPLGRFEFGSRTLTTWVKPGMKRPHSPNDLLRVVWQFRVNRFRGTWLAGIPCPLPEHYVLGFDEQKIETEGLPRQWTDADFADKKRERSEPGATDIKAKADAVARLLIAPEIPNEGTEGYPVYLNGDIRRTGWWYYYPLTLVQGPGGDVDLVSAVSCRRAATIRSRAAVAQELALCTVPVVVLFSMSFLTDINIGLRYVLAILPYVFIATGKVAPWILAMTGLRKQMMGSIAAASLALVIAATALIHPDYLAYFNWASGGPDRVPPHLIDSNLDWGQDLVSLQRWCKEKIPGEPIGLAYFGQINPSIFAMRGEPFPWFLAPVRPGTMERMPMASKLAAELVGPARRLEPGYYAVSVSSLYGLPWRFYDPAPVRFCRHGMRRNPALSAIFAG